MNITPITSLPGAWLISGETNGYVLVRGTCSMLIDCPQGDVAGLLHTNRLTGAPGDLTHPGSAGTLWRG